MLSVSTVRTLQVADVQLQYPRSIVVDRALGRVLVADQCNNRCVFCIMLALHTCTL